MHVIFTVHTRDLWIWSTRAHQSTNVNVHQLAAEWNNINFVGVDDVGVCVCVCALEHFILTRTFNAIW